MTWRVWADTFSTAEITTYSKQQKVTFDSDVVIRYSRAWVVISSAPVFTNLRMKIFAINTGDVRGALLHTSTNALNLSDILDVEQHGAKEIYFEFADVPLSSANSYFFCLGADTATFTDESHLAWKKGFPDPVYADGVTTTFNSAGRNPYSLYFIGAKL